MSFEADVNEPEQASTLIQPAIPEDRFYGGMLTILSRMKRRIPNIEPQCWEPLGYVESNGYWKVHAGAKNRWAHQVAFELRYGYRPEEVDHICNNGSRGCWNPEHLRDSTKTENRSRARKGIYQTVCRKGHRMDDTNTLIISTNGRRVCRACAALRMEKFHASH